MKCKHRNIADITGGGDWPFEHRAVGVRCLDCRETLSLGPSNDEPEEVRIEMLAAELASNFVEGVGIGGHRPHHCTGEHCWHWFADDWSDEANPCCYCCHDGIVLPGIENECLVGYLAGRIAKHAPECPAQAIYSSMPAAEAGR